MKMPAHILTIHDIYNYGSVLQAYASQRVISSVMGETRLIDYKYPNATHGSSSWGRTIKDRAFKKGNSVLKDIFLNGADSRYRTRYAEAKSKWYRLTEKSYWSPEALRMEPPSGGIYIVGSDQVWSPRIVSFDTTFFLDFGNRDALRASYASSFGLRNIPTELKDRYRAGLASLNSISVRERSGQALVKELTGRCADLVLDPTLMLSGDEWQKEAIDPTIQEPYIMLYGSSPKSRYMEELGLFLGKKTGWKVVRVNGKVYDVLQRSMRYIVDAGPREWLGLVANARLIVGQSFHATAFAVNFGIPFISLLRNRPDHDERQKDFLDLIGMRERLLCAGSEMRVAGSMDFELNFDSAHHLLREHKERSKSYLKTLVKM